MLILGAMVYWLERSLAERGDLGSSAGLSKFFALSLYNVIEENLALSI